MDKKEKNEVFEVKPFGGKPDIDVEVPGSKSMTNRALLLAALAEGKSILRGVLFSDDSRVFMEALQTLGVSLAVDEKNHTVSIGGTGGKIQADGASVYVGSAGTAARFLTAMLALSGGRYEMSSSGQMKVRPMKPLLAALEKLGVIFEYREEPYAFPFVIAGRHFPSKAEDGSFEVPLNIDESSQFLSALLLSGVLLDRGFRIRLTGKRDAKSYVRVSMNMMREFGCEALQHSENVYEVPAGGAYTARDYQIEPDVSAACYFYAMAAVNGGRAVVRHVHKDSIQGDMRFLDTLRQMGCSVCDSPDGIVLQGPENGILKGIEVDMGDFSDQAMTLAAIAPFASGPVVIRHIGHIRGQESNRIHAIVTELGRLGIRCDEFGDGVRIVPGTVRRARIHTYNDHRMAMAFAVTGTKVPGIVIENPLCCAKTFENYFDVLTNLGLSLL